MTTPVATKLLLTFAEAADELGVSRRTVADWVQAGALRSVNPNGRPFIPRAALNDFIDGGAA